MSRSALSLVVALAIASRTALAQIDPADPNPLTDKIYAWPTGIPYQVDPVASAIRGPQSGYNICNSTTQNQDSLCQTAFFSNITDFCFWSAPKPNSTIGDMEGQVVAWCTQKHGTRLIPAGTITGAQWLKAKNSSGFHVYDQLSLYIQQSNVDLNALDYGGELDPHGADLRGNPIGGLVYGTGFSSDGQTVQQLVEWNSFIGGNFSCFTACNPASSGNDQGNFCQNRYDLIGCSYNMPANAQNGVFEVCDADTKIPVGTYVSGGATMTWTQPNAGPVTPPYSPVVPASSNCVTYSSNSLWNALPTVTPTGATAVPTGTKSTAGGSAPGAPAATGSNGASTLGISSAAGILGTLFAVAFLS